MRRFLPALMLALLLCGAAHAKPAQPNVAGLTPGMTIDEAASKLGGDYQKSVTTTIASGDVVNFTHGAEGFNLLSMGGKILYIEHQQAFPGKALVSSDELAKALATKYGAPSILNDDQSEAWIIVDDKLVPAAAITDQQRTCVTYETQGPFFMQMPDKLSFAFAFPRVPIQPPMTNCGIVIIAKPSILNDNPGLLSHLTVTLFDTKAAQAWYDAAMIDYNKKLKDAVDEARKNKPNL